MKIKAQPSLFPTISFMVCLACHAVSAQESAPSPAQTPETGSRNVPTFVCLKQDYVDTLKTTGVIHDTQLTAVFVRFDSDFAVFRRPESPALVYIPKAAILYISAKPDPKYVY